LEFSLELTEGREYQTRQAASVTGVTRKVFSFESQVLPIRRQLETRVGGCP
jgi:hypothetical protein